ncbi:MAG: DUF2357 domain-containing protein [bacterium]
MDMNKDYDLVSIETDKFILNIKGSPTHPYAGMIYNEKDDYKQAQITPRFISCKYISFKYYDPILDQPSDYNFEDNRITPIFFEEQDYQIYIENKTDKNIKFYHENKHVREAINEMPGNADILWGKINFKSDVGLSDLEIHDNQGVIFSLQIEVFPSKLDYQDDYYNLLNEVNQEVYNLAYDFLRRTYQGMDLKEASDITDSEFFSILIEIFENFIQSFKRILKSAHHRLINRKQVLPAGRVRRVNRKSVKWLRKNIQHYDRDFEYPVRMLDINKEISYDTFENKFVKWIIFQLIKRISSFKKRYANQFRNEDNVDQTVINLSEDMINRLDYLLHHTFLKEVGDLNKIDSISLVLQMAPGYKEIYKYYIMLLKGLSLEGEIFQLSMKQVWQLYEYWCFLKLNRMLKNEYKLLKSNLIDFDYSGIIVTLNTGKTAEVKYENPDNGEIFSLYYNRKSNQVTTNQQPDNILSLHKKDSEADYNFVFDAKYRLDPGYNSNGESDPGPVEDTINTMHRYRDAIVYQSDDNYKREMVGAYVLFPCKNEEKFRQHKFYKSIKEVNVGALPFLPGSTEMVKEFLDDLIRESAISNYERNILPEGTEEYQSKIDFKENVIVGSLSKKKQLNFCLENNVYYTPYKKSILKRDLKYVALFQSQKLFSENYGVKYYAKINDIEIKSRREIDFPSKRNLDSQYLVFYLGDWQELDTAIEPEGYGIRSFIYSNFMLLNKASTIPELSIKTYREWRIWIELMRLKADIKVKMENNTLSELNQIKGFYIDNIEVELQNDKIFVSSDDKAISDQEVEFVKSFRYQDFLRNPRSVLKKIINV